MGRFHRHDDHDHTHDHDHPHEHDHHHDHDHDHEHPHDHDHGHSPAHDHSHPQDHPHTHSPVDQTSDTSEHGDHSHYDTGRERVLVLERIFDENDRLAAANRHTFDQAGVVTINVMSSPGAGKTTLLEKTLARLPDPGRVGVIEGDIETSIDADRLASAGARVSLLNTANGFGGECHLDAPMVGNALARLDLTGLDLLVVENVGNLVCPAEFDVGAHHSVMVYAITEGEEKPLKYPVMFRSVEVVVVNKLDLLPHLDFDLAAFHANLRTVNPSAHVFEVSARTGEGMDAWVDWLTTRAATRAAVVH